MIEVLLETVPDLDDPRLALPFVSVEVNGSPTRALLDSGAGRSALVHHDGLTVTDAASGGGASAFGHATQGRRTMASVNFAGSDLGMIEFAVVPPGDPAHVNLIGQDVLSQFRCEYRLAEGVLRLDGDLPDEVTPIHLDARRHIYLDATWPGSAARASAVFDTGASVTVVDQTFVNGHRELFEPAGTSHGTDSAGAVVETAMAMMRGPLVLRRAMPDSLVAIVDLDGANSTLERPMDLILGWPIISAAVWVFDHSEQVGACEPTAGAGAGADGVAVR